MTVQMQYYHANICNVLIFAKFGHAQIYTDSACLAQTAVVCCGVTLSFLILFTHCLLVNTSTVICWTSPCVILGVSFLFSCFYSIFLWKILLANNVDPDQMPHYLASDLGLHCLPSTLLRVSW